MSALAVPYFASIMILQLQAFEIDQEQDPSAFQETLQNFLLAFCARKK